MRRPLYRLTTGPRPTPGGRQPGGPETLSRWGTERRAHTVSEQKTTDAGRQTFSELGRMTELEILQANNLRLRVIQRELHSIKRLLIGTIITCIALGASIGILVWLT